MHYKLGGSNNRNLLPHSSEGQKCEIKVSAGLIPFESCEGGKQHTSLLASGSPCLVDGALPLSSGHLPSVLSPCVQISFFV